MSETVSTHKPSPCAECGAVGSTPAPAGGYCAACLGTAIGAALAGKAGYCAVWLATVSTSGARRWVITDVLEKARPGAAADLAGQAREALARGWRGSE